MDKLLSGRRVLVVEDEMLVLLMTEGMLADLGCESVTAAATVDQALALIDGQIFDAAILDMNLSGNKSHAVADALAARGVPFVFATGYGDGHLEDPWRDRPVLQKPFAQNQLADLLGRVIGKTMPPR